MKYVISIEITDAGFNSELSPDEKNVSEILNNPDAAGKKICEIADCLTGLARGLAGFGGQLRRNTCETDTDLE